MARAERVAAEAEAANAAAGHREIAGALAAARASAPPVDAASSRTSANSRPTFGYGRLLAGTALALMIGIGAGMWLGKVPHGFRGLSPAAQDSFQLRLDDTLPSLAARGQRAVPRDRPVSR